MHDVTWKFYVFQFLQIFQIELQNQNRAKYTKYLPIPFLLSFVNGPLRSPIALALLKKINAYFWGSLIRREALKFEDCRYESLQHGLARGHSYWRNVKWFPWKVGEHEISVENHDAKRSGFQLIECSPNLSSVYIRLCKHGNHFTFLF